MAFEARAFDGVRNSKDDGDLIVTVVRIGGLLNCNHCK